MEQLVPESKRVEVLIMGAGVAGLSLALQLKQTSPKIDILLVEKSELPRVDLPSKVGESTVEVSAHYFAEVLNLKEHIAESQLPKLGLRMFFTAQGNCDIGRRPEVGSNVYFPRSAYQLDRTRFENHMADLCRQRGIQVMDSSCVEETVIGKDRDHQVSVKRGNLTEKFSCRWLIDGSGRKSILQRECDLRHQLITKLMLFGLELRM